MILKEVAKVTIEKYFEKYNEKYHEMKSALKRYIDAKQNFYTLTGINYDDMPKAKGKVLGLDDLIADIEDLNNYYREQARELEVIRKAHLKDIYKLTKQIHRIIIEYAYLDLDKDKKIIRSLKEFHNEDYSCSHFRRLKAAAIKEFEEIIQNDTI